jgi:hypothetical protein
MDVWSHELWSLFGDTSPFGSAFSFINHEFYLLTMSTIPDFAMDNVDSRSCTGSWQQNKALSFLLGQLCYLPELIVTSVLHLDQLNWEANFSCFPCNLITESGSMTSGSLVRAEISLFCHLTFFLQKLCLAVINGEVWNSGMNILGYKL